MLARLQYVSLNVCLCAVCDSNVAFSDVSALSRCYKNEILHLRDVHREWCATKREHPAGPSPAPGGAFTQAPARCYDLCVMVS